MNVRELFRILGELMLLGKGDARVDMLCEGYYFEVDRVYTDKTGDIILGDYEAEGNTGLEDIEPQTVGVISVKDKDNIYETRLTFD